MPPVKIKLCGLTQPQDIATANALKVDMVGFVLHPPSPRAICIEQAAALARLCAPEIERVALLVNPDDELIAASLNAISPHRLQLHGNESSARLRDIKSRTSASLIKALPIGTRSDIARTGDYDDVADWFLFDAPAPEGGLSGGNATCFDWQLLKAYNGDKPWMLAGGLTPANVAQAIRESGAQMVDASSSLESARGQKDSQRMADFVAAVRAKP